MGVGDSICEMYGWEGVCDHVSVKSLELLLSGMAIIRVPPVIPSVSGCNQYTMSTKFTRPITNISNPSQSLSQSPLYDFFFGYRKLAAFI